MFSQTAIPSPNPEQGIFQVFHILNQFDIPVGVAREVDAKGTVRTDYTIMTVARDPQNLRYYRRSYNDQTIKMVDLKAFDLNAKQLKKVNTEGKQAVLDLTTHVK